MTFQIDWLFVSAALQVLGAWYLGTHGVRAVRALLQTIVNLREIGLNRKLHDQFLHKIVRHVRTGRIGYCVYIAMHLEGSWVIRAKFMVAVCFDAEAVKLQRRGAESLPELLEIHRRLGVVTELFQPSEVAPAPATDSAEFRTAIEA